jgi:hypothetical protein
MDFRRDEIEIIIECWTNPSGHTDFLWSIWRLGRRLQMGGAHPSADAAEAEARKVCVQRLGREAEKITRL